MPGYRCAPPWPTAGSVRPGGRTARTRAAVLAAALDELANRGWDQVSMETIAARARVHKTTVFRRWGSKDQLVAEALEAAADSRIQVPDSGDIDHELRALARAVLAILTSRDGAATVRALVAGAQGSAEVGRVVRRFWATRLARSDRSSTAPSRVSSCPRKPTRTTRCGT